MSYRHNYVPTNLTNQRNTQDLDGDVFTMNNTTTSHPPLLLPIPTTIPFMPTPITTNTGMIPNPNNDIIIDDPPSDSIMALKFSPNKNSNDFVLCSWNKELRYYSVDQNKISTLKGIQSHTKPVLDLCWNRDGSKIYSVGCSNIIKVWDLSQNSFSDLRIKLTENSLKSISKPKTETNAFNFSSIDEKIENKLNVPSPATLESKPKIKTIVHHSAPIRCIQFIPENNVIITASWDKKLKYWDTRSETCCGSINTGHKIYCMSNRTPILGVGLANKYINIYDLRKPSVAVMSKDTPLKHQLRCIDIFPNREGFGVGSIEGRCAISMIEDGLSLVDKSKNFSFKCHQHLYGTGPNVNQRIEPPAVDAWGDRGTTPNGNNNNGNDNWGNSSINNTGMGFVDNEQNQERRKQSKEVYAVNCLQFQSNSSTFVTGGSDGEISFWDRVNRTLLAHLELLPLPITALDFNGNEDLLAYCTSYDWSRGIYNFDRANHRPQIYLHVVKHTEISQ